MALKALPRAGWLRVGIEAPESVAAHSWSVAWLTMVLCPPKLDRLKVLEMAVVHDLPEVHVGDITPHDGVTASDKSARERAAMRRLTVGLERQESLRALWSEYDLGQSPEARFVKACDKLDMALQASVYADRGFDTSEFVESALSRLAGDSVAALAVDSPEGSGGPQ